MSVKENSGPKETVSGRVLALRETLGLDQAEMAGELQELVGTKTSQSQISVWERGNPLNPESLASVAMLHPLNPRSCLDWLRHGGTMPRIHVDRNETLSRAATVENAYKVLESALEAVYEILHPTPQDSPDMNAVRIGDRRAGERRKKGNGGHEDNT